jgi:hypothetical protein
MTSQALEQCRRQTRAAPDVGDRKLVGFGVGPQHYIALPRSTSRPSSYECREPCDVLGMTDVGKALHERSRQPGQSRYEAGIAGLVGQSGEEGALQIRILRQHGTYDDAVFGERSTSIRCVG